MSKPKEAPQVPLWCELSLLSAFKLRNLASFREQVLFVKKREADLEADRRMDYHANSFVICIPMFLLDSSCMRIDCADLLIFYYRYVHSQVPCF